MLLDRMFLNTASSILMRCCFLILFSGSHLVAQDFNIGTSTIHDENIFDISNPQPDQITQFQFGASKDWDFDQSSLNLLYSGSVLLFRDLTLRNYHVHVLTLNSEYHFTSEDEDASSEESDSTEADIDSTNAKSNNQPSADQVAVVHSDSLDRFLYVTAIGASQFDQSEFSQFDNSKLAGTVTFRQPLGMLVSARPSYTLAYHVYPNLSGITNLENVFSFMLGTSAVRNGWIAISTNFGIKSYGSSTFTYTYTVGFGNSSGHGKGGAGGGQRTRTIQLNTPSVNQFSTTIFLQQKVTAITQISGSYTYLGEPSRVARILPEQLSNALERRGVTGAFTSQNEIFDDHYSYSAQEFAIGVQQSLPLSISLSVNGRSARKTYSLAAVGFDSTSTATGNRIDTQLEGEINLTKAFTFKDGKSLKPQFEFHYIRNGSNVPYYDFHKSTFMLGLEFDF